MNHDTGKPSKGITIGIAGVFHETNSFAPGMTDFSVFEPKSILEKEVFMQRYEGTKTSIGGVLDAVSELGVEFVPAFNTGTTPSGLVTGEAIEKIIQEIVHSLSQDCDGLILVLHGAMVSESYWDVEGELLRQVRHRLGSDIPIAVTLDLHANISNQMVALSDIIVGYDTYPHIDMYDRAIEATSLLVQQVEARIHPYTALKRPGILIPPQTMITTQSGPMKELIDRALEIEEDPAVLNVTVAGGFPFSDIPDAGMSFLVTTDGDELLADQYADELSTMALTNKKRFHFSDVPAKQAVQDAYQLEEGPVILAEGSDNVGGGGPADATHLLELLVDTPCKSLIVIKDAEAALLAHQLGVGSSFEHQVGGKADERHGNPVEISGNVRLLFDGVYRNVGRYMTGGYTNIGQSAVIETGNVTVLLTEKSTMPFDVAHVQSAGIDPEQYHIIVVKSAVAWRTAFGDIARHVIHVDSPGCCSAHLQNFDYHNITRPIYPFNES